jgi:hypothetical protein
MIQRRAKPPNVGGVQPGGGETSFKWAREMFANLGSRMVSEAAITEASDVLTGGIPHLQLIHPTPSVGPASTERPDVAMTTGVTMSVIPQVSLMDAGAAAIGPAPDASIRPAAEIPPELHHHHHFHVRHHKPRKLRKNSNRFATPLLRDNVTWTMPSKKHA